MRTTLFASSSQRAWERWEPGKNAFDSSPLSRLLKLAWNAGSRLVRLTLVIVSQSIRLQEIGCCEVPMNLGGNANSFAPIDMCNGLWVKGFSYFFGGRGGENHEC